MYVSLKIKLYWPQCKRINGKWQDNGIDSYWVECSYEEEQKYVLPYLTPDQVKLTEILWKRQTSEAARVKKDLICFLVSKDLKAITPMVWYYPYSGHWNGNSPFIRINETKVTELEELRSIVI